MSDATGASSAAPLFFEPKRYVNKYGLQELLIDGGVICNNPTLYAYEIAHNFYGYDKIRVLSLGTGEKTFHPITNANQITKYDYL
jgi:patatin-like phospholipase/acyl hydrolase